MHMSIYLAEMKPTYYLLERKAVCRETNAGTTQMTSLVKGPRAKSSRAEPFNDWALARVNHCSYGRSSTRFFSKIASIFKKVLHLKDLNHHLECILV